jgi:hypothetical protein
LKQIRKYNKAQNRPIKHKRVSRLLVASRLLNATGCSSTSYQSHPKKTKATVSLCNEGHLKGRDGSTNRANNNKNVKPQQAMLSATKFKTIKIRNTLRLDTKRAAPLQYFKKRKHLNLSARRSFLLVLCHDKAPLSSHSVTCAGGSKENGPSTAEDIVQTCATCYDNLL